MWTERRVTIAHSIDHGAASPSESLDLYRLRDDLAQHFNPCGSYEVTLVGLIAQALLRLQAAYEDERQYRARNDMVDVLQTRPKEYEAVTRNVSRSECAWRQSVRMLEDEQRRRQRQTLASPNARRAGERPQASPAPKPAEPAPWPPPPIVIKNPEPKKVRAARRE